MLVRMKVIEKEDGTKRVYLEDVFSVVIGKNHTKKNKNTKKKAKKLKLKKGDLESIFGIEFV